MAPDAGEGDARARGFADRQQELFARGFSFSGYERDLLSLNLGDGRFFDISGVSGIDSVTDGRSAVFGDFDNDGDTDVFLTTIQGANHLLFRNEVGARAGWLRLTLEGSAATGREAWGAVVRVKTAAGTLTKSKMGGSGYLAQSDPRLLFGLGSDTEATAVEVTWPSGQRQRFASLPARSSWKLVEGEKEPQRLEVKSFALPDPVTRNETGLLGIRVRPGQAFPAIEATTMAGAAADLPGSLSGRQTLVVLWATWCVNCKRELPALARLREELGADKLEIVGLSLDRPDAFDEVRAYAQKAALPYPVLLAEASAPQALYAGSRVVVPVSFLVGADGIVREVFSGWSAATERRVRAAVR